jgi:hypothetical protein|tara:strand:- start:414 stop:635 length:222 start_codon:yes stop_codon:yes gene_type:complete
MKFTYKHITKEGTTITSYKANDDGTVTTKVLFEHDKFFEFDKWFDKLTEKNGLTESLEAQCIQYDENESNKYY